MLRTQCLGQNFFISFPNGEVWIKMPLLFLSLPYWKGSSPKGDIKLGVKFG